MVTELLKNYPNVEVVDPHAESNELWDEYGFKLVDKIIGVYNSVIVAVNHHEYSILNEAYFRSILSEKGLLVDLKGIFRNKIKEIDYWTL